MNERRCLVTGETQDKPALIRFVLSPQGEVTPDLAGDLPGRGLWVGARRELIERAVEKRLFSRAARTEAKAPADLAERVAALLRGRALGYLGFARRAGQATVGFEKVRERLERGRVAMLVQASDASPEGRARLRSRAVGIPSIELFSVGELSLALGRENVVHAALAPGRLAVCFAAECGRLAGFARVESGAVAGWREGSEQV